MFIRCLLILIVFILPIQSIANTKKRLPNIVYISIDGVSRDVLYGLLTKHKLPNMGAISKKGGVRNLTTGNHPNSIISSYTTLFTGFDHVSHTTTSASFGSLPKDITLFEKIKNRYPHVDICVIPTTPQNLVEPESISPLLTYASQNITVLPEKERSTSETGNLVLSQLELMTPPFVIFANFTRVEYSGHRFREGTEDYSQSLQRIDREIGKLSRWIDTNTPHTVFYITTPYGFTPKSKQYLDEIGIWLISSEKIRYTGTQASIVPTIYSRLSIPYETNLPSYPGKKLIW